MGQIVRGRAEKPAIARLVHEIVRADVDAGGIEVLEAGRYRSGDDLYQERVVLVGKFAKHESGCIHEISQVRDNLLVGHLQPRIAEHHTVRRAACAFEFQYLEVADEGRRIDEDVVVGGLEPVAGLFQTGVNLPSRRDVVSRGDRCVLLPHHVHERRRCGDFGHFIREVGRVDLIAHSNVVGDCFRDMPGLLVDLLPMKRIALAGDCIESLNVPRVVEDEVQARRPCGQRHVNGVGANAGDVDLNVGEVGERIGDCQRVFHPDACCRPPVFGVDGLGLGRNGETKQGQDQRDGEHGPFRNTASDNPHSAIAARQSGTSFCNHPYK